VRYFFPPHQWNASLRSLVWSNLDPRISRKVEREQLLERARAGDKSRQRARSLTSFFFLLERAPAKENHRKTEESPVAVLCTSFYALRRETMSVPAWGLFKLGTNAPGIYSPLADLRPYLLDDAVGLANVVFDDPLPFVTPSRINPR